MRAASFLVCVCVLFAGCASSRPHPVPPFSRRWDPDYAVRGCHSYDATPIGRHRSPRKWETVCVRTPVPTFNTVSTRPLLGGENLTGADMRSADLAEAHLTYADLSGANLRDADLFEASIYRARLRETDLSGADLDGADLVEANLTRAKLDGADLTDADFEGSDLTQTSLQAAVWSDTTCPDGTNSDRDGRTCAGHLAARR